MRKWPSAAYAKAEQFAVLRTNSAVADSTFLRVDLVGWRVNVSIRSARDQSECTTKITDPICDKAHQFQPLAR